MSKHILALIALLFVPLSVTAGPHDAQIQTMIEQKVKSWLNDPVVIKAVKKQNQKHQSLQQSEIDKMDKVWRAEVNNKARPMVNQIMNNALSQYLKGIKQAAGGLYTEIFVMDNKGLNAGQSDVTSDYWQGDEGKWKKTFLKGADAVFIDEVEFDESTQQYQAQTSLSITDPSSGATIGAVTIGINVEML